MIAQIIQVHSLNEHTSKITLAQPAEGYPKVQPGQFIKLMCGGDIPRPFSVSRATDITIDIVVQVRGPHTEWLLKQSASTLIEISLPLGNGFTIETGKKYLLVGGGIGVAPLLSVASASPGLHDALLCFKTKSKAILVDDFRKVAENITIATDDGSYEQHEHGRADEILQIYLMCVLTEYHGILACGPTAMLEAVAKIAAYNSIPCQVSLEAHMSCGIGACKGCVIETCSGMKTVCKDGPVFASQEVVKWPT